MNRNTRLIIAATLVLLGVGVVALGFLEDESTVRYVDQLYTQGDTLSEGSYTLLGIPQPEFLPDGSANPEYHQSITGARSWRGEDGTDYITRTATSVNQTAPGEWTFTTTERTTTRSSTQTVGDVVTTQWVLEGNYQVFQIKAFETEERAWAAFGGVLNGDIQPKPSQLQGHLSPDAPAGVALWMVEPDGYTVGCSSKFLPDEVADEYDADGDGYTD